MVSEEKFLELRGDSEEIMGALQESLLGHCLRKTKHSGRSFYEPVPDMELKRGRLLRFQPRYSLKISFFDSPGIYSFALSAAILSNGCTLHDRKTFKHSVSPGVFSMDNSRSSKMSPRSWYRLLTLPPQNGWHCLDPNRADHTNALPLLLSSAILKWFANSQKGLTHEFDSPLVCRLEDALPYFIDKICDAILWDKFLKSSKDPLSLRALRAVVVATKFLLYRLSRPDHENSHTIILESLIVMIKWRPGSRGTFSSQEAIVLIPMLEDIFSRRVFLDDSSQNLRMLWIDTITTYRSLIKVAPSVCSLRCLLSMANRMSRHWDAYQSTYACEVLTDLLEKRTPVTFMVFHTKQCLEFLGNHAFRRSSGAMVRAYVVGILAMQRESDVDAVTLKLHIDYLHKPHNLFTVCSIFAADDHRKFFVQRDITTLVQLLPTPDTAWDDCRGKFRNLAQGDCEDFK